MENRAHALIAGLFVVLLGLALVAVVYWFDDSGGGTRDVLLVTERNVNGLNPLAQVRYRGMRAGKVISITLDPRDQRNIQVLIRVDADLPLTRTTTAQLNAQGITGLSYVQLEDGEPGGEHLPIDDARPPRISIKPTLMESLGDQANDIVGQVSVLANRLNKLLDERNLDNISRTVDNVQVASEGLRELPAIMEALHETLSPANLQRLEAMLVHLEKASAEAAPLAKDARGLMSSLQGLTGRIDGMVAQVGPELSANTLPRVNALVDELVGNSRQLQRLLDGLETTPQSLLLGPAPVAPGPGEAGFVVPAH